MYGKRKILKNTLYRISKFQLISWSGYFTERYSFRRVSGESPETLRRLCLSTKFPHQEISILRSDSWLLYFCLNTFFHIVFFEKVRICTYLWKKDLLINLIKILSLICYHLLYPKFCNVAGIFPVDFIELSSFVVFFSRKMSSSFLINTFIWWTRFTGCL